MAPNEAPPSGDHPGPHPEPPADLGRRHLPLIETSAPWFRCHLARHAPLHFGTSGRTRFAAPSGEYGVLYLGGDPHCAFIETFGQATGQNIVTTVSLAERALCRVEATRPLALVDLTGTGLAQIGADARLTTAEHAVARRWAAALRQHSARPDGIFYRARHDPSRFSAALFDRAAPSLRPVHLGGWLDARHAILLADIFDTYRFGLREGADSG